MFSKYSGSSSFILISFACVINVIAKEIEFGSCGPDAITSVDITPCAEEPCNFKKGTKETMVVDFTSTETSITNITSKVLMAMSGIWIHYPLPQPNACTGANLTCPLQPGRHFYTYSLGIPSTFPCNRLVVKWMLEDQNGQVFMCFEFEITVTD